MCRICRKEYNNDTQRLICSGCLELQEIPMLPNLIFLSCSDSPKLVKIPYMRKLQILECSNCPLLKKIPGCPELEFLDCSECPLIKDIPPKLDELHCYRCPLIQEIPLLSHTIINYNYSPSQYNFRIKISNLIKNKIKQKYIQVASQ